MTRLEELATRFENGGALVAGILSGTSGDGIDVALARVRAHRPPPIGRAGSTWELEPPELRAFDTLPFDPELAQRVRAVLDGEPTGLRAAALLHRDLGRAFGAAARGLADRERVTLDLAGSHGQAVWHHDGVEPSGAATLQLGDGDFVAEALGCPVVSDFRQRDIAAGGEGAPISALADDLLFARAPRPSAILNLGGMANLTLLFERQAETRSFDTGPANSLLDGLARELFDRPFDADGALAARGRADEVLVGELLAHPFFERPPPKSTGRDTFGEPWVREIVQRAGRARSLASPEACCDLLASGVELVAASVALALERFSPERVVTLYLAGGGVHNRALVGALERHTRARCVPSSEAGVDPDAREGLVFAVLAARAVLEIPVTNPNATGACTGRVLGKLSFGARGG